MNEQSNVSVVIDARDDATPKVKRFTDSLVTNREAISNLASGVTFMGTAFLTAGIAMQQSNNQVLKSIGGTLTLVGSVASFLGMASQFTYAVSNMTKALRAFNIQQIIAKAFSGPAGWLALGVGAVVAAGVTTAVVSSKVGRETPMTTNNYNIGGSVVTERELGEMSRHTAIKAKERSGSEIVR